MSSDWEKCTLGDVLTLQRGMDLPIQDRQEGSVPIVASNGIVGYHNQAPVKGPGVLIGRSGSIGGGQYIKDDFWPLNTTLWVKDFKGNNPRFCYFLLRSIDFSTLNAGTGVPTLNRNHLHPIPLSCPPPEEQSRISELLGALDDRINLLRDTNATLEAIAQALFKSWFVDFDPVHAKQEGRDPEGMDEATAALFPDSFDNSEAGMVPLGWKVGSILDIAKLLSGGTPKTAEPNYWGGDIPWASAKDVSQSVGSVLVATERTITVRGLTESSTRMIPALATAVVARGATTGRMVLFGNEMAMNQTCYALESRTKTPIALYCQLRREIGALVNAAHGSVFDTITTDTFVRSRIVQPPNSLVARFEEIARPIFEKIIAGTRSAATLMELRDTLLPHLILGRLRLSDEDRFTKAVTGT